MRDDFDIAPMGFLTETECGQTVVDLYCEGPFFGRTITDRLEFIDSYISRPLDDEMTHDASYEAAILREVVSHLDRVLGSEWESYLFCEVNDDDWFLEGFANEGLEIPKRIGEVEIGGIEHSVWR